MKNSPFKLFSFSVILINSMQFGHSQSLDDGLLFYIPIDNSVIDVTENNVAISTNGSFCDDSQWDINGSICLNGNSQIIDFSTTPLTQPELPITFSCDVNVTNFGGPIFGNDISRDGIYSGFWIGTTSTGKVHVNFGDGGHGTNSSNRRSKTSELTISTNTWHNIVVVIRGPLDMDIYIDCLNARGSYSGNGGLQMVYAGNSPKAGEGALDVGNTYLMGKLDNLAMWSRELSLAEIELFCDCPYGIQFVDPGCDDGDPSNGIEVWDGCECLEDNTISSTHWLDSKKTNIKIYPNPTSGDIYVDSDDAIESITLYTLFGQEIKSVFGKNEIDIQDIESGVYLIKINQKIMFKIIKK